MIGTKVIVTRLMPRGRYIAITLFGLVFTHDRANITPRTLNHELIHCAQQLEWLYIPFFILYVLEWLYYLIKYRDSSRAYYSISFEREAYAHDRDFEYLQRRKLFANYRK